VFGQEVEVSDRQVLAQKRETRGVSVHAVALGL